MAAGPSGREETAAIVGKTESAHAVGVAVTPHAAGIVPWFNGKPEATVLAPGCHAVAFGLPLNDPNPTARGMNHRHDGSEWTRLRAESMIRPIRA